MTSYSSWNSPGQNTGVGSLSLLQWIFPTQGMNPGLLHCRHILYQLRQKGIPRTLEWVKMEVKVAQLCPTLCDPITVLRILQARILEWVAFPFSRGSSQLGDWTQVSWIACRFFTSWATREALEYWSGQPLPSPLDLPNPGIEQRPPGLDADSLPTELSGKLLR